ncbi:hypothetical protein OCU04_008027 [Sclerotinia nivalis]|uniref:Zn(2)-C6 fungal-type domain-containing protein n=1 Tax=Sclerotinia nivalis TaxID=352851 RepID=A0A9X0AI61_9HELO|nr:hypothetical protein OCU04_008027 [Sclerotinia nivalis]
MVGVPKSNRCDNCRKRKKKCGEQRPSCAECIRSGWTCPGYSARWKFMDETAKLAKLYSRKKYIDEYDTKDSDVITPEEEILSSTEFSSTVFVLENFKDVSPEISRFHDGNPLATTLVYCLGCKVKGDLIPLWLLGSFFQHIPGRLGHSTALDDAVSCVCSLYCDRSSNEHTKSNVIYREYIRALSSLQKCLADENLRFQSETICASLLLQMCELAVNIDKGRWGDLARGTAQLIQARGVYRHMDPFDLGMLESQLSYIVIQSAKSEEDCYLRQPEWRALLTDTTKWPRDAITAKELTSMKLRLELCLQLFELPSILIEVSSLHKESNRLPSIIDATLMNKALAMCSNMKEWLHSTVEPHIYLNPLERAATAIEYPDMIAGVVDCVANTTLLTLDKIICLLHRGSIPAYAIDTFDGPETVEDWYRRALTAFEFVQNESTFAAKPLGVGLRQFQSSSPKPLAAI